MNFVSRGLWIVGGLGLALAACAPKRVAPVQNYSLGLSRAGYRDYAAAKANICDAEPRWLTDELSAMNGLMEGFLSSTEQAKNPNSVDHGRHMELLKEASGSLGKVLDVHQANLRALQKCGFAKSGAFPQLGQRGQELVEQSRTRLTEGGELLALQEAQRKWQEEAPQREQTARQTWCAKTEVGSTDVFYARQFADGRTEWLFCDGHVVQSAAAAGSEPTLVSPEGLSAKDRRKVKPPKYLEAARGYPPEEVDKQPTLGGNSAPAHSSDASGE
ncbi:MAG TPA: hypothetical protein VF794_11675 [Archangium sp.]|jgi:hypothetical protein|uniref:hypothetical protein n=1 Tax=Archangium sp. TaxID=1872627 RepID=UPI002ED85FB4